VIDCHTHITSCRDEPSAILARAHAAGVTRLVTIGSSPDEMQAAVAVADHHPGVFLTAGMHPHHADLFDDDTAELIRRTAAHPRCVAIGETGLDFYRERVGRDQQRAAFVAQLRIARECRLPVVIHCREADEDCFTLLADAAPATVILHCFAAVSRVAEAAERGYYCSFAGNVTYPSAASLQDAARRIPDPLLLLETDAPYLAPVPHRGRPNEPAYVIDTLRFVAALRGVSAEQLASLVEDNADRAFGPALRRAGP
jgi:TatD DNase family protein